jgi:hypothetical protein
MEGMMTTNWKEVVKPTIGRTKGVSQQASDRTSRQNSMKVGSEIVDVKTFSTATRELLR